MTHLVAASDGLVNGNGDLADILFLAAFIVFVVAAVLAFIAHSVVEGLVCAGLALVALALLVLSLA